MQLWQCYIGQCSVPEAGHIHNLRIRCELTSWSRTSRMRSMYEVHEVECARGTSLESAAAVRPQSTFVPWYIWSMMTGMLRLKELLGRFAYRTPCCVRRCKTTLRSIAGCRRRVTPKVSGLHSSKRVRTTMLQRFAGFIDASMRTVTRSRNAACCVCCRRLYADLRSKAWTRMKLTTAVRAVAVSPHEPAKIIRLCSHAYIAYLT